jgi:hypothetical protein
MENTARRTGSKYDLATKAEVAASLGQVEQSLADMRRTWTKALDKERHATAQVIEHTLNRVQGLHKSIEAVRHDLTQMIDALEDRTIAGRWRRLVYRVQRVVRRAAV